MSFIKPLPEWNAVGSEPPQSKKDDGWAPDERPPADWWNWFQNRVYQALLELQENAATNDQISSLSESLGTKLNASAYTAADVLAKIKTIDGAESGLDADKLDNLESTNFFQKQADGGLLVITGQDLNNVTNSGFYNGDNLTNAPTPISADWFYIEVLRHTNTNGYCLQRATGLSGTVEGKSYQRVQINGTWGTWKGVGSVNYKTYASKVEDTILGTGVAFDINLVNVTGKGFVDVLTAYISSINLSLADGIEIIVDGQVLWSYTSSSGSTSGVLLSNSEPLIGPNSVGFSSSGGAISRFDRIYFNSSFRVRAYGTTSSSTPGNYGVLYFAYHLEQ